MRRMSSSCLLSTCLKATKTTKTLLTVFRESWTRPDKTDSIIRRLHPNPSTRQSRTRENRFTTSLTTKSMVELPSCPTLLSHTNFMTTSKETRCILIHLSGMKEQWFQEAKTEEATKDQFLPRRQSPTWTKGSSVNSEELSKWSTTGNVMAPKMLEASISTLSSNLSQPLSTTLSLFRVTSVQEMKTTLLSTPRTRSGPTTLSTSSLNLKLPIWTKGTTKERSITKRPTSTVSTLPSRTQLTSCNGEVQWDSNLTIPEWMNLSNSNNSSNSSTCR